MGGTLRIISSKPDTERSTFEFTGDFSNNAQSDDMNYQFQAITNIPFSETFAIRLAAAYDKRGGVVDATNLVITDSAGVPVLADPSNVDSPSATESRKDVNGGDVFFAKAAALWRPADNTEVLFNYLRQDEDWKHGTTAYIGDDASIGAGPDSWQDSSRGLDAVKRMVDLASLDINHEFGFASFTSSTSYSRDDSKPFRDTSDFYETIAQYYFFYPRMLVRDETHEKRESFTQEFRLVSNGDSSIDWVAGLYYHESKFNQAGVNRMPGFGDWADDPNSSGSQIVAYYYGAYGLSTVGDFIEFGLGGIRPSSNNDLAFTANFNDKFEDLAAFGEVTFHPSEAWQITLGARVFKQKLKSNLRQTIPYCGASCSDDGQDPEGVTLANNSSTFNDSIFKFNTSWDISENHMLYFTASQGFRRGGANALPLAGPFVDPSFPLEYTPDKVLNKELGLKGFLNDGRVSYSAALYYILIGMISR